MGELNEKNKTSEAEKVSLKDLDIKYNFDEILGSKTIMEGKEILLGHLGGPGIETEIDSFIAKSMYERNSVLINAFSERLNDIIPDDIISDIAEVVRLNEQKTAIDRDIANLTVQKRSIFGNSLDDEMQRLSIITKIEEKEKALKEIKADHLAAYQKACSSSMISHELSDLYNEIKEIQYEQAVEIQDKMETLQARLAVLKKMSARLTLVNDIDTVIDQKIKMYVYEKVVRSAALNIPLIKVLIK